MTTEIETLREKYAVERQAFIDRLMADDHAAMLQLPDKVEECAEKHRVAREETLKKITDEIRNRRIAKVGRYRRLIEEFVTKITEEPTGLSILLTVGDLISDHVKKYEEEFEDVDASFMAILRREYMKTPDVAELTMKIQDKFNEVSKKNFESLIVDTKERDEEFLEELIKSRKQAEEMLDGEGDAEHKKVGRLYHEFHRRSYIKKWEDSRERTYQDLIERNIRSNKNTLDIDEDEFYDDEIDEEEILVKHLKVSIL